MMYYTKKPVRFIAEVTPRHIGLDEDNSIVVTIKNLAYLQKATVCLYQTSANGGEYQVIQEIDGVQHGDETATINIPANTLNTGVFALYCAAAKAFCIIILKYFSNCGVSLSNSSYERVSITAISDFSIAWM